MKKLLAAAAFAVCTLCGAWQIDSSYKIVIPAKPLDGTIGRALAEAAEVLRTALANAGIKVKIEKAAKPLPGKKSIFLGFPDGKEYAFYDGSIHIDKRDIFITGNDAPGRCRPGPRNSLRIYYLGTYTALAAFMQEYLDCRFVLPCKEALCPGNML